MKKLAVVTLLCIGISMQAQKWWGNNKVKGNGNVITKTRTISNFDHVNLIGSFDVNLVDGKEGTVKIEAEENLLPYIETIVENGQLKLRFKKNTSIHTNKGITITVPFESINQLSLGGSGKIEADKTIVASELDITIGGSGDIIADVKTTNLETSISGSGDIELSGKSEVFDCSITGSGSIKAYSLDSNIQKSDITGSGDIYVTAHEQLKARVVGSGDIYYKGKPKKVKTKVTGSGNIIDKN